MTRKIVVAPNDILTTKAQEIKEVNGDIKRLIEDMKATLLALSDPPGVGIAAPQVNESLRLFLIRDEVTNKITSFLNPEILKMSKETYEALHPEDDHIMEGCLSIPGIYGKVTRANSLTIKYLDENGREHIEDVKDLPATYIQHEYDHLEGILFTTRALAEGNQLFHVINDEWHEIRI